MKIILASSSSSRKELMSRLAIPFEIFHPEIDESPLPNESHFDMVARLSQEKAEAALPHYPGAICIGSDAIASLNNEILGKPNDFETAFKQLKTMQNQTVIFYTGICVVSPTLKPQTAVITTDVVFKALNDQKITHYLNKEKPFDAAGSFKSETLGSALVTRMSSTDPSAIMGLPLITLCDFLERAGRAVI